jgi:thioredoxin 1
MSQIESVTDATFALLAEDAEGVVAVDFWAAWCPPCRITKRILAELAPEYESRVRILALDSDANPVTAARFGVRSLPTLVILRGGVEIARIIGAVPRAEFEQKFDEALGATPMA